MTKSVAPRSDHVHGVSQRAVAGDDDRDDVGVAADRRFDHARAVDAGQAQVGDDDVEGEFGELFEGLLAGCGLHDDEPVVGEALSHGLAQRCLVLYEEKMLLIFSHLCGASAF